MGWSAGSEWTWTWSAMANIQNGSRIMLSYYNDTGKPVLIQTCYLRLGTGDSSIDVGSFTGNSVPYYVTASATGTDGVTRSSQEVTVANSTTYGGSGIETKTFNFASPGVYVAAGSTVNISMYFRMPTTWRCVVTARQRNDSSTFGGSVTSAGMVRIWNGSSWVSATPYIYNGSTWVQAMPYVYNGSSWVLST